MTAERLRELRHNANAKTIALCPRGWLAEAVAEIDARGARIAELEAALASRAEQPQPDIKAMVDRFLNWELPRSVASDSCATQFGYPHGRTGANLLTSTEAEAMLRHVLELPPPAPPLEPVRREKHFTEYRSADGTRVAFVEHAFGSGQWNIRFYPSNYGSSGVVISSLDCAHDREAAEQAAREWVQGT